MNDNTEHEDKIYWHDAFFNALQIELDDYINDLIFDKEHPLSKESLKMDVLIIKKSPGVRIEKNIGRIFRGHNIFEYKSETVSLSVWDYHKVIGYAMIYSAFERVSVDDITISFVVTPRPVKLFEYLETRGFRVSEKFPGIYYLEGDTFGIDIQIIENKKLPDKENLFLKHLRSGLTRDDLESVLHDIKKHGPLEKTNAYLSRVLAANTTVTQEVLIMGEVALQNVLYEYFNEKGMLGDIVEKKYNEGLMEGLIEGLTKGAERKNRETALELLKDGIPPEKIARYLHMPLEWVEGLR